VSAPQRKDELSVYRKSTRIKEKKGRLAICMPAFAFDGNGLFCKKGELKFL